MVLVEVMPLTLRAGIHTLSYFSADTLARGALVHVPLRNKKVLAVVLSSVPLKEAKARVRRGGFALKKVSGSPQGIIAEGILKAAEETARFHAASLGVVLASMLPPDTRLWMHLAAKDKPIRGTRAATLPSEGSLAARIARLRKEARRGPLCVVAPRMQTLEYLKEQLVEKESEAILLHAGLSKKKFGAMIEALPRARFFFTTPHFAALALPYATTLVLEEESSSLWRGHRRPFIDARVFLRALASACGASVIPGDTLLRLETLADFPDAKRRSVPAVQILSTKTDTFEEKNKKTPFRSISLELETHLRKIVSGGGQACVFAVRRGLAPSTVCRDCGTVVRCPECAHPLVLHEKNGVRVYLCHHCTLARSATITCGACSSWNLIGLGVGSAKVEEELRGSLPEASILRFDSDLLKTHAQAKRQRDLFYATKGAVLVATDMALPYLTEPVDALAVASLDSLLSLPVWNAYERAVRLLCALADRSKTAPLVQTRLEAPEVFAPFASGSLAAFHKSEDEARRAFQYPPHATIVRLSSEGSPETTARDLACMQRAMRDVPATVLPRRRSKGGRVRVSVLARLTSGTWPDETLLASFCALPPHILVMINPEDVLS